MAYHMARKQLHDSGDQLTDDNIGFFAHMFFNKVNHLITTYDNITFCWEGEDSIAYRRKLFPDYKGNRKAQKDEDEHKTLMRFLPKVEELLHFYPVKHIRVKGGEADDVIFAICQAEADKEDRIVILSSDKDLTQITLKWPNVSVYNPIFKKTLVPSPNIIMEKSICGDSSDNIPGLYRVGPKTLEKMLADKTEWDKVMKKDNNQKLYERFTKLIDLSLYPKEYHDEVVKLDEYSEYNEFQPDKLEYEFWELKMKDMLNRWENMKSEIWMKIGKEKVDKQIENMATIKKVDLPNDEEADELDKIIADFV